MINTSFFKKNIDSITLHEILKIVNADLEKNKYEDTNHIIFNISTLDEGSEGMISFFDNRKYIDSVKNTKVEYCFIRESDLTLLPLTTKPIIVEDTCFSMAKIANEFYKDSDKMSIIKEYFDNELLDIACHIAKSAKISNSAKIGNNVIIGENVVIHNNVEIEDGVQIGDNTSVFENVKIGKGSKIFDSCSIRCTEIGEKCIIKSGSRIGQSGFGFAHNKKTNEIIKFPQLGLVKIGNFVEIGSNTTVDRGSLSETIIDDFTKLDNLIQIGHNVKLGKMNFFAAQTGIAGSTEIGSGCLIGGQSAIAGHLKLGNKIQLAARSGIMSDVENGAILGGSPAFPIREWHRMTATLKKISEPDFIKNFKSKKKFGLFKLLFKN